jgi:hypothetical protein
MAEFDPFFMPASCLFADSCQTAKSQHLPALQHRYKIIGSGNLNEHTKE